jgi:hypothetical protein
VKWSPRGHYFRESGIHFALNASGKWILDFVGMTASATWNLLKFGALPATMQA